MNAVLVTYQQGAVIPCGSLFLEKLELNVTNLFLVLR